MVKLLVTPLIIRNLGTKIGPITAVFIVFFIV